MFMPKKFSENPIVIKEYDVSNIFNAASGVMHGDLRVIKEEKMFARLRIRFAIMLGEIALSFLSVAFMVFPKHPGVRPFLSSRPPSDSTFLRKDLVDVATKPMNSPIQKSGEFAANITPHSPISVPNKISSDTRARQVDTDMNDLMKGIVRK